MKYIDLHCDTLTRENFSAQNVSDKLMVTPEKLEKSCALAQCFAVFTDNADFKTAETYIKKFQALVDSGAVVRIDRAADFLRAERERKVGGILTVENLGFIGENLALLDKLVGFGVKMASLVWNNKNSLASPNLCFRQGGYPLFERRCDEKLTPLGREVAAYMDKTDIIMDISHLSDGGAEELLCGRKRPLVASHSGAAAVCNTSRNLSDGLIKKIADCGGVVGIYYCKDFLGGKGDFPQILAHVKHIIKVGGEKVIALGSDFDGIPENPAISDCTKVPELLNYLNLNGISGSALDGLAFGNFMRVFSEICG